MLMSVSKLMLNLGNVDDVSWGDWCSAFSSRVLENSESLRFCTMLGWWKGLYSIHGSYGMVCQSVTITYPSIVVMIAKRVIAWLDTFSLWRITLYGNTQLIIWVLLLEYLKQIAILRLTVVEIQQLQENTGQEKDMKHLVLQFQTSHLQRD